MGVIIVVEWLGISALLFVIGHASGTRWLRYPMMLTALVIAPFLAVFMAGATVLSLCYLAWLSSDRVRITDISGGELESYSAAGEFSEIVLDIPGARREAARSVSVEPTFLCFRNCTDLYHYTAYCLTQEQMEKLPITRKGYHESPPALNQPYAPEWFVPLTLLGAVPPGPGRFVFKGEGCWVFLLTLSYS